MTLAAWWALTLTCLVGAASPGPSLAVVMANRGAQSAVSGFACAWGHAVGVGIYGLITAFGLAVVIASSPFVFTLVQVAGALYLLFIASQILRGRSGFSAPKSGEVRVWQAARDGFLVAFLNPKLVIFFTALFSQFVGGQLEVIERFGMAFIAFAIDGLWYSLIVILMGAGLQNFFEQRARILDIVFALIISTLAVVILGRILMSV